MRLVHNSWALLRVAKAFLRTPNHDVHDLVQVAKVDRGDLDKMIPRMVTEGWLTTADGWIFQLTPTGRAALTTMLTQARTFNNNRQGGATP